MKIFILYYLFSGLVVSFITALVYDKHISNYPIVESIGKNAVLIIQFFLGFLMLPYIIFSWTPLACKYFFLKTKHFFKNQNKPKKQK